MFFFFMFVYFSLYLFFWCHLLTIWSMFYHCKHAKAIVSLRKLGYPAADNSGTKHLDLFYSERGVSIPSEVVWSILSEGFVSTLSHLLLNSNTWYMRTASRRQRQSPRHQVIGKYVWLVMISQLQLHCPRFSLICPLWQCWVLCLKTVFCKPVFYGGA